ncbi:Sensor protein KdpD [Pandoraea horticolens]|uniref:histidine kinase n=1 Tax=Pandoraea horticolens TaxID=2508298 RepID=A0A5E4R7Q6_9BURK|nr:HAMP domain-containing sensor histidine kinase [Pandoraea horticolens]VVD59157.1 Sensor protein KdpD [Pandoraea horticolens]
MATAGKPQRKRWLQRLQSWDFTLITVALLTLLILCLVGAVVDISISANRKERLVQESELKGQLAQFLLSTREPDGSSLLENPTEFSAVSRPLSIVTLRRSFFSYMLQRGNAKVFKAGDINFEPPRACQVEYPGSRKDGPLSGNLRVCFAAVPGDQTGRYVYFSLRYPSSKIERHRPGRPLADVNRVVFTFGGQPEGRLTLAYQVPPLARSRYPSQLARFEQVHELSGFALGEGGVPSRLVSGQAIETQLEEDGSAPQHFVTVVGRIDAAFLQPSGSDDTWPSETLKKITIGLKVYDKTSPDLQPEVLFDVPPGKAGTPLVSLTQAYLAAVPSRASLHVSSTGAGGARHSIWRSDDAGISQSTTRLGGWWQDIADRWSEFVLSKGILQREPVSATQSVRIVGLMNASATLTATPFTLPDLATRAFTWISGAVALIVALALYWGHNVLKLRRLRAMAYAMAAQPTWDGDLKQFAARNEIGTLARVFHLLLKRSRSRDANLVKRLRKQETRRAEKLRLTEAHVQNRKAILDAIGHEIRAPLQSLVNTTKDQPPVQQKLSRIRRAVEALHEATGVEDGLRSGEIAMAPHDLVDWLQRFAHNLNQDNRGVEYVGPRHEVVVQMDSIQLEQILDNLLDNAQRYREPGTNIELRLSESGDLIELAVFNRGVPIPETDIERIFDLGVSDSDAPSNSGLGLFASRIYALAMDVTLRARNEEDGVSLVLQFPRSSQD